jgi:tetratricopeptide (TPR) repeat protein
MLRRKNRGPLAAWLIFVGTLFPVLGFFNVYPFMFSYVADHFQYLACLGMIVLASAMIATGLSRLPTIAKAILPAALVAVLTLLSWRQSRIYGDVFTLYHDTLAKNPQCWLAENNLGFALAQKGDRMEAIKRYQQALRLKPDYASAENNLGSALADMGITQEAMVHFEAALRDQPVFAAAENNLGNQLVNVGRRTEAVGHFQTALRERPFFPEAENNLAIALFTMGRPADAMRHFQAAINEKPDDPEYRYNLAVAYEQTHQHAAALASARKGLELARSQGNADLVNRIADWLSQFGSGD